MELIRPRFRDHVNLAAGLGAIFCIVQGAADPILLDRIRGYLQAGLGFLGLFLDSAGVNAIKLKVVIISRPASETNRSLIAATVVLSKGGEKCKTCPIASVVRKVRDLSSG